MVAGFIFFVSKKLLVSLNKLIEIGFLCVTDNNVGEQLLLNLKTEHYLF